MDGNMDFRYSIGRVPEGEAVTGEEVEKRLLKALAEETKDPRQALWSLARWYSKMDRHEQAAHALQRLMDRPLDVEAKAQCFLALGQLAEQVGDFRSAVARYRVALAIEPAQPHTWYFINNNLGFSLNQLGEYEEAEPFLQTALRTDPKHHNAYNNLGLSMQGQGRHAEAARWYVRATQVEAADARSLKHLEDLVEAHPQVLTHVPGLDEMLEACREAVTVAKSRQPDPRAAWEAQRRRQKAEPSEPEGPDKD